MNRRDFLVGTGTAIALSGCSLFADPQRLRVLGLTGSIPGKIVKQIEEKLHKAIEIKTEKTPLDLWQKLKNPLPKSTDFWDELTKLPEKFSPQADRLPDVVGLSDAWLDTAITQQLITPFSPEALRQIPQWSQLSKHWQEPVTRAGQVWAIPYRWGTTAIAYRQDKTKFAISSWADLWRPELKGRLILPDDPREVIGLVLKKLGHSYQTTDLSAIANLNQELGKLHEQVLTYSSDNYLQPLLIDDSWVSVGWSQDMAKAAKLNSDIKLVIPAEGTALWSDLWVLPKQAPRPQNLANAYGWLNFCLEPAIANQITALTTARSTCDDTTLPNSIKSDPLKFPSPQILASSEFLLPLPPSTVKQYTEIWAKLRS